MPNRKSAEERNHETKTDFFAFSTFRAFAIKNSP